VFSVGSVTPNDRQDSMTDRNHEALIAAQFGPRAAAYVASPVHSQGEDLQELAALVAGRPGAHVLDLGCGGGHASFAAAATAAEVVAFDLSAEMLAAVAAVAAGRGLGNIRTEQGSVAALPFPDASFDIVLSRQSAHHWGDLAVGLAEARRVVRPDGTVFFIDSISPGPALLDTHLQAIEILRDPSHVRDYTVEQWRETLGRTGFRPGSVTRRRLWIEFQPWIERMSTSADHVAAIRSLQRLASSAVQRHFEIAADGSFTLDTMSLDAAPC
jgi:ubiquinone/menaquinone biosynthesis C-methylase UbiE